MSPSPQQLDPSAAPVTADFGQHRGRRALAGLLVAALVAGGATLVLGRRSSAAAPAEVAPIPEETLAVLIRPPTPVKRGKGSRASAPPAARGRATKAPALKPERAPGATVAPAPPAAPVDVSAPPPPPLPPPAAAIGAPEEWNELPLAQPASPPAPVEVEPAPQPSVDQPPSPARQPQLEEQAFEGNGEAIARAIAADKRRAIQSCFEKELKDTPTLKGNVPVELDLAPPQRVDNVRVVDDLGRPTFTQCVSATMQHVTFVALNEEVSVQMPFVLTARAR